MTFAGIELPMATSDWRITRQAYSADEDAFYESLFHLSNGALGVRNTVDFASPYGWPGVFHRRLYGPNTFGKRQIINVLNPTFLGVEIDGRPLGSLLVNADCFEQTLDMRHAYVETTVRCSSSGAPVTITIRRFVAHNRDAMVSTVRIGAPTGAIITCRQGVQFGHGNRDLPGRREHVRVEHLEIVDSSADSAGFGIACRTRADGDIVCAFICSAVRGGAVDHSSASHIQQGVFGLSHHPTPMSTGVAIELVQVATLGIFGPECEASESLARTRDACRQTDVPSVVTEHIRTWDERWQAAPDIRSSHLDRQSVKYAAFQLLQLCDDQNDPMNVPARALSSEYHSGHYFFNSEFFLIPYFCHVEPGLAKRMIRHRLARLDAAKSHAVDTGYAGARFPEEADDRGHPGVPHLIRDSFSGDTVTEWSGIEVVHTTADVLYALMKYVVSTRDHAFLRECAPLLVEAANYLASVLKWDRRVGGHTALGVMGFDEFHYHLDHHFGTNWLCSWALKWVADVLDVHSDVRELATKYARVDRCKFALKIDKWREIGTTVYLPPVDETGVQPLFGDYFRLPDQLKADQAPTTYGNLSDADARRADRMEPFQKRLTKQADVLFIMTLFPEAFSDQQIATNLAFYEPRTVHGSSLSMSAHASAALRCGDHKLCLKLLRSCISYNTAFFPKLHYNNGVHVAAYAGAWLVIFEGMLNLRVAADADGGPVLHVAPNLCAGVDYVAISVRVGMAQVRVEVEPGCVRVAVHAGTDTTSAKVTVWGQTAIATAAHPLQFTRSECEKASCVF